jgi:predicted nucleic acid-binding Zn ribbon protein
MLVVSGVYWRERMMDQADLKAYVANCLWCNEEFVRSPPHKKFCSEKCKSKFNFQKRYKYKLGSPKTRICPECNQPFAALSGNQKLCSLNCIENNKKKYRSEWIKKRKIEWDKKKLKGPDLFAA